MAGVKYPTFANWVQQRGKASPVAAEGAEEALAGRGGLRLLEAVEEESGTGGPGSGAGLCVDLRATA